MRLNFELKTKQNPLGFKLCVKTQQNRIIKPLTVTGSGTYEGGEENGFAVGFSPVVVNVGEKELQTELDETKEKLAATENTLQETQSSLQSTKEDLQETTERLESTEGELAKTESDLQATRDSLESTTQTLENTALELQNMKSELETTENELTAKESELKTTQAELSETETALQAKTEELNTYTGEVTEVKNDLKTVANNNGGGITEETPFSEYSGEFERVIGEKYEQGHADGVQSEYDRFWDELQENGERRKYWGAFSRWKKSIFKPKYELIVGNQSNYMFWDAQVGVVPKITFLYEDGIFQAFAYTSGIHTIEEMVLLQNGVQRFDQTFIHCTGLRNLKITGTIGGNGFNVQWSPLTHESLMSIINALKDYSEDTSGTEWIVTLGSANIAKLSQDDIKIAENKGWRLA